MPIIINGNTKDIKYRHRLVCDYCTDFVANADDEYLNYSGYSKNKPKFAIKCSKCHHHQFDCNFIPGCIIPGYGRVNKQTLIESMEKKMADQEMVSRKRTTQSTDSINWETIEERINAGTAKVKSLAEEFNLNSAELRLALEKHYGDKVVFKRGRTGGIFWNKTANNG